MPSHSKRRKAIQRKKEMANHQTPTNSSGPQGNGAGDDNDDSSDHPFTDEEIPTTTSMEAQPDPNPEPAVSEEASVVAIEQQTVSESEQTEVASAVPLEVLEESSAPLEVREKSGEGTSYSKGAEIPVAIPRDARATGPAPLLERRASWWNCCGLLDAFGGSQR